MTRPRGRVFAVHSPVKYLLEAPLGERGAKALSAGRPDEEEALSAILRLVPTGTFVDYGARFGNSALFLAAHGWRGVCFETDRAAFELLQRNVSRNGFEDSIAVVPGGLASRVESPRAGADAAHDAPDSSEVLCAAGPESVLSLDGRDLTPDLVRMDIADRRFDVPRGLLATIARSRPAVVVRCPTGPAQVQQLLKQFGYRRVGAEWAGSRLFIFVARPLHRARALLLVGRVSRRALRRIGEAPLLGPFRRAFITTRALVSRIPQRLHAHRRRIRRSGVASSRRGPCVSSANRMRASSSERSSPLIVSMTTFPARTSFSWIAIESCLDQSLRPDGLVLCLARDEFSGARLPKSLERYLRFGLRVLWIDESMGCYQKLIPIRRLRPDATVVTADDDVVYERDWLIELVETGHEEPNAVVGHRGWEIAWNRAGLAPYTDWTPADTTTPSERLFLTGVGGVLYPPGLSSDDILCDVALAKSLCPTADDVWFWAVNRLLGVPQRCIGRTPFSTIRQNANAPMLWSVNSAGGNDRQIAAVAEHLGLADLTHKDRSR